MNDKSGLKHQSWSCTQSRSQQKVLSKTTHTLVLLVLLVCLVLAAGFGGLEWWEADVCPLVLLPVALLVVDFEDVDFWKMKVSHIVITTVS